MKTKKSNDFLEYHIRNISKKFDTGKMNLSVEIISNFSLSISNIESIVMLGPSGCGKSTLLKIIGGILPATSGTLELGGINYGNELPKEVLKKFGFVFQNDNLLQWRTVKGNLNFMLEMMSLKGPEWKERVEEMLDLVGLLKYENFYPHELSGGMRQRVGIARALVHSPEILVFDQPFGALDAITRKMLAVELLRIWKKTKTTLIMVTNNVDEAVLLAERVLVFSNAPMRLLEEVRVDIPVAEREASVSQNADYLNICEKLAGIIRNEG